MTPDRAETERRADCAIDTIAANRREWDRRHRRPPALTAREALAALQFEALVVWIVGQDIRAGVALSDADLDRLGLAVRRIDEIAGEALR